MSAKVDYAVRALTELAATPDDGFAKGEAIARRQGIPLHFMENILSDLKRAGIVGTQRGGEGGYRLAVDPGTVSIADVIRLVEGPLADVHGIAPEDLKYKGVGAATIRDVWVAARASLRSVLEEVTVADLLRGTLPTAARRLLAKPEAYERRRMRRG